MKITTLPANLKHYQRLLQVSQAVDEFMQKRGYLKVDVPVLAPSLIPESYLEIFETEFNYFDKKQKLYLTPSPELMMKRLLVNGIKDPFYLGKAFRNSEPNSDFHSPEFTMLEYYRVGFTYLQLADEILEMMRYVAQAIFHRSWITYKGKKISFESWEKYTIKEAFEKFAGVSQEELLNESLLKKKAKQKGYKVEGFSYSDIFSQIISQEIEPKLGKDGFPTLLYDYPSKMSSLAKLSPDGKTAKRVEFYIDGVEIGGCCEELNDWKEQNQRFIEHAKKRNDIGLIHHEVDNGFIEALKYGLPDCTGAGIGFERLAMIFTDVDSIDKLKLINIA